VLHAAPHTTQVDSDDSVPLVAGAVGDRCNPSYHPGVVERGIESTALADGAIDHRRHISVITDVATDGECRVTASTSDSASACTARSFTSASTTAAPGLANAWAVATPMPAAAPVTRATLPVKSNVLMADVIACL
jgi:hypothetical protein